MTVLAHGDRQDAVAAMRERFPDAEFVAYADKPDPGEDPAYDLTMRWRMATLPRQHLVFVNPPKDLKLKDLKPGSHRHFVVEGKLTKSWQTWGSQPGVEVVNHHLEPAQLVNLLMAGAPAAGIPRFTKGAAEHLVVSNPGGLQALAWPIQLAAAAGSREPIGLEAVTGLWPFVPITGKTYAVKLPDMLSAVGTSRAVELANKIPAEQAIGTLEVLKSIYKSKVEAAKVAKKPCDNFQKRVKLIEIALTGMREKRWNGKAALVLFTLACYQLEAPCPSSSKATNSSSPPLTTPLALYQLLGVRP